MDGIRTAIAASMIVCALPMALRAQVARSGGSAASSQLQLQLQQVTGEKARVDAENAQLKKDLEQTRKDMETLKKAHKDLDDRVKGVDSQLAQSNAQRESTDQELNQAKGKLEQLIGKFRETAQSLHDAETERAAAQQLLANRDRQLGICSAHNAALYKLNGEVLERLDSQGMWSRIAAAEPFTRLKRIQNENLADDFRARALDQLDAPPK